MRTRHGARGVLFQIAHEYSIVAVAEEQRAYDVFTSAYRYRLLDAQDREILAYHWHPISESWATFPHLHLTSRVRPIDLGPNVDPAALAEMHLPTGPVSLADIVRLLIMEFDVAPRRPDWQTILQAAVS